MTSAVKGFRRKLEEDATRRMPLYREAHDGEKGRYLGMISASANWFKKNKGIDTTIEDFHTKGTMRKSPWRKQVPPQTD